MTEKVAIIDLDYPKYSVACVGEERYIEVVHTPSGRKKEFKGVQEFYGKDKARSGGWLGDLNKSREVEGKDPFQLEAFEITPKQRLKEPLANVLHSTKNLVEGDLKASGATSYEGFIGQGTSFRHGIAKMQEYKGKRDTKPLYLQDVTDYLSKKYSATVVTGLEADDQIVIRCKELLDQGVNAYIIGEDKDYRGCPVQFFDVNRSEDGIVDCRGFGEIWYDERRKTKPVIGRGRLFKYFQICCEDSVDCYKANSQSNLKWGKASAYKALVDCKDDQEAWNVMVEVFKKLYPEPVTFDSWDGSSYTYSWLDCLKEMFLMASMKEYATDERSIIDYFEELGVNCNED